MRLPTSLAGRRLQGGGRAAACRKGVAALLLAALAGLCPFTSPRSAAATREAACAGDCDIDRRVAVNELIVGVNISLGMAAIDTCPSFDVNEDETVAVNELVTAVNNALNGCADEGSPTGSPTATSPVPTFTPTPTPTENPGPVIVFFGVTLADDSLTDPTAFDADGIPIYARQLGFAFSLVVEGHRGTSRSPLGVYAFDEVGTPDLQVQATRALGDGSSLVCDNGPEPQLYGGVPGIDPPRFDETPLVADALNDFGCRFVNGAGLPLGRGCADGCVLFETGEHGCVASDTELQFCAQISLPMEFPAGDTLVTARIRDLADNLGAPAQLIIRIEPP